MAGMDKAARVDWLVERGWSEGPNHEYHGSYRMVPPQGWFLRKLPRQCDCGGSCAGTFDVYNAIDLHEMVTGEHFE